MDRTMGGILLAMLTALACMWTFSVVPALVLLWFVVWYPGLRMWYRQHRAAKAFNREIEEWEYVKSRF